MTLLVKVVKSLKSNVFYEISLLKDLQSKSTHSSEHMNHLVFVNIQSQILGDPTLSKWHHTRFAGKT